MAKSLNWKLLREEYRLTDLSLTAFAKEKGIARSTAVNHLKDIDDEKKNERLEAEQTEDENDEIEGFVPIEILDQEASLIESIRSCSIITGRDVVTRMQELCLRTIMAMSCAMATPATIRF